MTSAPAAAAPYWSESTEVVLRRLGSTTHGLTKEQAATVLVRVGANTLDAQRDTSAWRLLLRQFLSPIVLILIGATVLSGLLGDFTDAVIILVILLLSGLLGFWQERGAGQAMKALLEVVEIKTSVLRDGGVIEVPMDEIVPGDVVRLAAGDLVPGDCLVLESQGLNLDESALTGETFPVEKTAGTSEAESELTERTNALFLGTHVSSGSGSALVVRTGRSTEMGSISGSLKAPQRKTGFERGMTSFGLLLTRIMIVLVVVIFVVNLLLHRALIDSALFSLALAVGLTPQLLPAIVSISLAQGARMIAKQRVIVRRLDSIEDFGSMTILCSDKTGTMTQGKVTLDRAMALDGKSDAEVQRFAWLNASLQIGLKNPIDEAIIEASASEPATAAKLDELPYDFNRRRLSVLVQDGAGTVPLLLTKGSLDAVLEVCTQARGADGSAVSLDAVRADLLGRFAALSADGYRVLGVASRELSGRERVTLADEAGMQFLGLLTFADPVKPDAPDTLAELARNGLSVRMLTGDNHLVAAHTASLVGLDVATVLTGKDIDALDDAALAKAAGPVQVFSELNPLQKERIVRALGSGGEVVGYLGDGINDAPSLKAADVGISVDTAVAVAKESADIVLLDKDLKVLLAGMTQGRRTFANTMKYIFMSTSSNFGNMLSMAIASVVLPFLPLLAGQILLINLLGDLPATTIATDSVDVHQLNRPQRWNIRLIRNYMIVFGALSSVFDLITFGVLRWGFHAEATEFRSAWFLASVLTEVCVIFVLRTRRPFFMSRPSKWLALMAVMVSIVAFVIPYTPVGIPLQLIPLPPALLGLIGLIVLGYIAVTEIAKRFFWPAHARMA